MIGIPTIRRDKTSYLQQTVSSLIQGMSVEEQKECLIIVFVAEVCFLFVCCSTSTCLIFFGEKHKLRFATEYNFPLYYTRVQCMK